MKKSFFLLDNSPLERLSKNLLPYYQKHTEKSKILLASLKKQNTALVSVTDTFLAAERYPEKLLCNTTLN